MKVIVAPLADFDDGERKIVKAGGRSIGVFRAGDRFYAIRNRCPHQGGPLCLGPIVPTVRSAEPGRYEIDHAPAPFVACPWHRWEYDLATGQSFMGPDATRVRSYDVSVQPGGTVREELDEAVRERVPGPYIAETFPVTVEDDYVVLET
jgi:nitrite reductase/ring-hydroxylating ferredoxin subunit